MKKWLRKLSLKQLIALFAVPYVIVCLMALFPPLYLWASGSTGLFLGMPVVMWYWLVIPIVCTLVTWILFLVEGVRGELDLELADLDELANEQGVSE